MRATRGLLGLVLVLALGATPGPADEEWELTNGGWVSGRVDYVDTVLREAGTAVSAKLHANMLYVTSFKSFSIYDVTQATKPVLLSQTPLGAQLYNEQPDTNGRILLLANDAKAVEVGINPPSLRSAGSLEVYDVTDKTKPVRLAGLLLSKREHIWTCVLDCTYAYGARGAIVDLADPANPKLVGDWIRETGAPISTQGVHTIEEVAPGRVLTGSSMVYYLDVGTDPTKPRILAQVRPTLTNPGTPSNPTSLPAHLDWPDAETGRFIVMSMETPFGGDCDDTAGGFRTYDTTGWEETERFTFVDEYVFTDNPGTYTNGRSAHHAWGCSAYALDAPEHFTATGQVAVAWFEDGLRLLRVDGAGKISEIGGFLPIGGSSATPIWRNDEVVYVLDLYRGIDILRVSATD